MEWGYNVWEATHEDILKPSFEAKNSFWIKNRTGEDMGQFSADPVNKAVQSFTNSLTRVREWWRKTFSAFISTQKDVRTYGVCTVSSSWDNFW